MAEIIADNLQLHIGLDSLTSHIEGLITEESQEDKDKHHERKEKPARNMLATDINSMLIYSILSEIFLHMFNARDVVLY